MPWIITPSFTYDYDSDALAYITAVETVDGQSLETGVKDAINAFVVGCKADGIWAAIKASCILAGARTLAGALVPLVGTAPANNNFVSGDYSRKTGLLGDGNGKYLNSNRNNAADPQNNQHMAVFATAATTSSASVSNTYPVYMGAGRGDNGTTQFARNQSNGALYARNRSTTPDLDIAPGTSTGLIGMSRSAAGSYVFRAAGNNTTITSASEFPYSANLFIYASNHPTQDTYSNARLAFYSIGESLNLALLDSRVTTLVNALAAAIP